MKNFIKNNSVLVSGIMLPFLLMAAFAIANYVHKANFTPPKYDFLYFRQENNYENAKKYQAIRLVMEDGKLSIYLEKKKEDKNTNSYQTYYFDKLYLYSAASNNAKEIVVPEVTFSEGQDKIKVEISELKDLKIDISATSPDGYVFQSDTYYNGNGGFLISDLMFGSRSYYGCTLKKSSNIVKLPLEICNYNSKFGGWIIK